MTTMINTTTAMASSSRTTTVTMAIVTVLSDESLDVEGGGVVTGMETVLDSDVVVDVLPDDVITCEDVLDDVITCEDVLDDVITCEDVLDDVITCDDVVSENTVVGCTLIAGIESCDVTTIDASSTGGDVVGVWSDGIVDINCDDVIINSDALDDVVSDEIIEVDITNDVVLSVLKITTAVSTSILLLL